MDLDNFIIGKTKEWRGEGRVGNEKQQLLSKHREEKVSKKAAAASQTQRIGKVDKKSI
jgi:hypothetical protein